MAASTFSTLCAPGRGISLRFMTNSSSLPAHDKNIFAAQASTLRHALFAAKPEDLRLFRQVLSRRFIIEIQYGSVEFGLILKQARFGARVSFQSFVTVQMIGSQVQEDADVRAEVSR